MLSITQLLNHYGLLGLGREERREGKTIHEKKTVVLTNRISVLIVIICIAFSLFDYLNGIINSQVYYVPLTLIAMVSYWVNHKGLHTVAKHIIILASMLTTFYFSLRTNQETYVSVMYFPIVIGSFALFGYRNLLAGLLYSALAISLFLFEFLDIFNPFVVNVISEDMVRKTRIINYLIISLTVVFLILFILSINYQTEKKIKEQNEELIKTNTELDKFVYSTSHDLRAPLMSILGLVNIAEIEKDHEKIEECLKLIKDRVHTLDNFITEIIDISRNKKSGLQINSFQVSKSINSILDDFRYMEKFDQIKFDLDISDDLEIESDETRFNLIMRNLISNAIKYHNLMQDNPRILVSCQPGEFTLKVKVEDNGFGIEEKHQSKLFDMFFRGTQKEKGTGLGLYIVKETAHKLDGKITMESSVGEGTVFELEIPIVHENGQG